MNATTVQAGSGIDSRAIASSWQGERLLTYRCCLGELSAELPRVVRRPFTLTPRRHLQTRDLGKGPSA